MKILPYCLPALLTALFVALAYLDSTWIFAVLLFAAPAVNSFWGVFSPLELSKAYTHFHYSAVMSLFKGLNGVFFVLFNLWAAVFCVLYPFDLFSFATFVYGVIVVNSGMALSLAHELIHEKHAFQRRLGDVLMLQNGFFYLSYDHVFIHHPHVGTSEDPASALLNENLYAYLQRSLSGRMRMLFGDSGTGRQQQLQRAVQWKLALCAAWLVAAFFIHILLFVLVAVQYFLVILIYETTTYIQHYGLRRRQEEKITLDHSWNSFDRLHNYLYFFMPVHSLHHAHLHSEPGNAYPGPAMPESFPRMLSLAFLPGRWFRMMNPLVRQVQDNQAVVSERTYD